MAELFRCPQDSHAGGDLSWPCSVGVDREHNKWELRRKVFEFGCEELLAAAERVGLGYQEKRCFMTGCCLLQGAAEEARGAPSGTERPRAVDSSPPGRRLSIGRSFLPLC